MSKLHHNTIEPGSNGLMREDSVMKIIFFPVEANIQNKSKEMIYI